MFRAAFAFSLAVAFGLLWPLSSATAQTPTGRITGRVTDPTGATVPNVLVTALALDTNQTHQATSNAQGDYTILYLPPGQYSLQAKSPGFRLYARPSLSLAVEQALRIDIPLELGATTETVTVTETAPLLTTETGARGNVITQEEISDIPLSGRNFNDLAFLTGGVIPKGEDGDGAYAVNGARADNVGFLVDGMNNTQRRNTGAMVNPPVEGIQEFKLITSGFAAEYGRYAGGILSVVTKSGTNRLRGSLYEFLRNDVADARGFFELEKSKLRRNQFGATVSGPVLVPKLYNGKDRTFFLFSWESLRQVAGVNQRGITPLPAFLRGDFSAAVDANDRPLAITDPLARAPFPNKQIPSSRLDPVAAKLAAYFPAPNLAGTANNYVAQENSTNNFDNFNTKVDHTLSPRDRLTLSAIWRPNRSTAPFTRSPIAAFGTTTATFEILSAIRYLRTINSSLFAEASVNFSRRTNNQGWPDNTRDWSAEAGFLGGTKNPVAMGLPQSDVSGYITLGHAYDLPKIWVYNNYQYAGALTWVRGAHTFKFGGDFLRYQYFSRQYGDTRGRMTFLGRFTNEPMADFVLGYAQTTRRQLDAAGPYHLVSNYSAFFQDDFKVTSRLTLNLGLRYELMKPPQEKFGAWSMFLPDLGKIVIAGTGNLSESEFAQRIAQSGVGNAVTTAQAVGLPATLIRPDRNDFGPRFGFAWRPTGNSKSVLRGGYGIFYGTSSLYRMDEFSDTYPFSINESYSAVTANPLALTVANPYPEARRRVAGITSTSGQEVAPRSQYLQSFSLTAEREFGGTVLEIAYAGSKGTHLPRRYDVNQPLRDPALRLADGTFPRPFPNFQTINYFAASSNSIYNSGAITVKRRFSRDLFVRATYTYAKSIDETSNTGGTIAAGFPSAQDSRNLHGERGRSDFDIGHSFAASFLFSPRFSRHLLLRNWQMAGVTRAYTGQPFTVKLANYSLDLGEAIRPDRVAKGTLPTPSVDAWFDRAAFPAVPRGSYRFGNAGRNILDGPGLFILDLSLSRRFKFAESKALQARLESFNLPNRANFSLPETRVDVRNGGTISATRAARVFQLGLRLEF